jgi:DNA-binding MurR/RpiR family transcriptional regulator
MAPDVLDHLRQHGDGLSGKFLTLANFVAQQYRRAAFMTSRDLAKEAGVSLPTVVRFVSRLGFKGFQEFSRALQDKVSLELNGVERVEEMLRRQDVQPLYAQVIGREIEALKQLMVRFPRDEVAAVAERLIRAPAIAIVAVRYLGHLPPYFAYTLRKLRPGVHAFSTADSVTHDDIALLPPRSLVIAIGFARYAAPLIELVEAARQQRREIIAITDHVLSPIARLANHVLIIPAAPMEFIGSMAAPCALINVLVSEVALRQGRKAFDRLELLEKVARARSTYDGISTKDFRQLISPMRNGQPRTSRDRNQ